jgi:EEF1A lysine methyltransferase 1
MALDRKVDDFLKDVRELPDLNQYWYSAATVKGLADEIRAQRDRILATEGGDKPFRVAFLSTPSIYFAFSTEERKGWALLDYDDHFKTDAGWAFYDFNKPEETITDALRGGFDMVVIDPPFITEQVWTLYAQASKLLFKETGPKMMLGTTIFENFDLLRRLFGEDTTKQLPWSPSIPNLVYQYSTYCTGFEPLVLNKANPEIPE